jgi:DNA-binding response OmpR family regulator
MWSPRPVVFFMTGYGDSPTDSDFLQTTAVVVLAKPLGIDALFERVRGLLQSLNPGPM